MVGRTLNRYRIVEQVGHGGMAVVFRGVDESLEREVAVKLLHPHLAERVEHRRRLAREAKAVARLRHPNILEIFDFSGEDSPEAFIITELIKGRTLKAFATEHPFSPPELAAACVYELAGALAHAHDQGIIHRDLKPENVMIQEAGNEPAVKLMDFGIAQIIDRDDRMTVTGSLMGSPAHMGPEIINGEEADARSDIFSLGTILYWLVTGSLPFEGASPGALLKKILEGEFTDPRALKPDVSDSLARVIADALARERAQRIPSAKELQSRLQAVLSESGIDRPHEVLTSFLKHPQQTGREVRERIVGVLMTAGADAAKAGKVGKALSTFGRVIAIAPGTPEAGAARDAIDRMKSRVRWKKRGIAAGVAVALSATVLVLKPFQNKGHVPPAPPVAIVSPTPRPSVPPAPRTNELDGLQLGHIASVESPIPKATPTVREPLVSPPPKVVVAANKPPATVANVPLIVHSKPWGTVYVDGVQVMDEENPKKPRLTDPAVELRLPAGKHLIEIRQQCCEPFSKEVNLLPGRTSPELVSARLRMVAEVTLNVKGPDDTVVKLDGQIRGTIGQVRGRSYRIGFPDGQSSREIAVVLWRPGAADQERRIALSAGDEKSVDLEWTGTP
jgi:serine/threonine-protein kinase